MNRLRIVPQLAYQDIGAALEWLAKTFGFREREEGRFTMPDGTVGHAEMEVAADVVFMLGSHSGHGTSSPRILGGRSQYLAVYVDDIEAHYARTRAAGAPIELELEDTPWGDRRYQTEDLEGHRWSFHQQLREVAPGEWQRDIKAEAE